MSPEKGRRGASLGLVLAVVALVLLAAFTAANVSLFGLRVSSRVSNLQQADNLAESVVQQALAHLQEDLSFSDPITLSGSALGLPQDSRAFLTFDDASGQPYSTNNFLGENPDGWNRSLPEKSVHLVGVGEYGGVRRYCEVIARLPEFPVAVACDGPIDARNCLIGGFDDEEREWVPGEGFKVEEDELEPGHLTSNAASPDSIVLDSRTRVTGDVQSRGLVNLNGALVEGEVRQSWGRPAPIPKFDLREYDPAASEDIYYEELVSPRPSLELVGNVRFDGDLTLTGDLKLDNSFLFVNGDLTVQGSVNGKGALVVMGQARFHGTTELTAGQEIAVLAENGIEVTGRERDRSVFNGLLYTKGFFKARELTIVGGFVVDGGGRTELEDLSVFYSTTSVSPSHKRESYAVIPRFMIPTAGEVQSDLARDPTGFPFGQWTSKGRHVVNVLDIQSPDWRRSSWAQDDPAVVSVRWVNEQPLFRYEYWGQNDDSPLRDNSYHRAWDFPDGAALAEFVANENTGANTRRFIRGAVPDRAAYEQYLLQVLEHLEKQKDPSASTNFGFDANEFINDGERIRIAYRRLYSAP